LTEPGHDYFGCAVTAGDRGQGPITTVDVQQPDSLQDAFDGTAQVLPRLAKRHRQVLAAVLDKFLKEDVNIGASHVTTTLGVAGATIQSKLPGGIGSEKRNPRVGSGGWEVQTQRAGSSGISDDEDETLRTVLDMTADRIDNGVLEQAAHTTGPLGIVRVSIGKVGVQQRRSLEQLAQQAGVPGHGPFVRVDLGHGTGQDVGVGE
jgi:hypothetical protein